MVGIEYEDSESLEAISKIKEFINDLQFWQDYIETMVLLTEDDKSEYSISILISVLLTFDVDRKIEKWIMEFVSDLSTRDSRAAHKIGSELMLGILYTNRHRSMPENAQRQLMDAAIAAIYEQQFEYSYQWSNILGQLFSSFDMNRFTFIENMLTEKLSKEIMPLKQVNGMVGACYILNNSRLDDKQTRVWLSLFTSRMDSAFQESRDAIGSGLEYCSQQLTKPRRHVDFKSFLKNLLPLEQAEPDPELLNLLESYDIANVNRIKSCLSWFVHGFYSFNARAFTIYLIPFLKMICQVSATTNDPDLLEQVNETIKLFPYYSINGTQAMQVMDICWSIAPLQSKIIPFTSKSDY